MKKLEKISMKFIILSLGVVLFLIKNPALASGSQEKNFKIKSITTVLQQDAIMEIVVNSAWARPSVGRNGVAFINLTNHGKNTERLIEVKSKIAKTTEIHTHLKNGDIMRMRAIRFIVLEPKKKLIMKPGGLHIMLAGLTERLVPGMTFSLSLFFDSTKKITIEVPVTDVNPQNEGLDTSTSGGQHSRQNH